MNLSVNVTQRPVTEAGCFLGDSLAAKVGRIIPYCLIIPLSLIGNSLVVAVVARESKMRKTVNFFIVNMCVADILVTVVYMPRVISLAYMGYEWQVDGVAGLVFCKIAVCFNQTSIAVTIYTIVAISLDRFFAVVFPFGRFITVGISHIIIVCTWIAGLLTAFPQFYGIQPVRRTGKLYCFLDLNKTFGPGAERSYYLFTLLGLFAIPLSTIVILYSGIMYALIKRRNLRLTNDAQSQQRERTRKKVLKMVSILVAAFIFCFLLYFIHFILYSYGVIFPCALMYLRLMLLHLNSAVNPCIYYTFNENFRRGFHNIFIRFSRRVPCTCVGSPVVPFGATMSLQQEASTSEEPAAHTEQIAQVHEQNVKVRLSFSAAELPNQTDKKT